MTGARLRPLLAEDEEAWRGLWAGYLDFYKTALPESVTAQTFRRLLVDPRFFALIAETEAGAAGFVHCVFHPATWSLTDYCYLEDLFVSGRARRRGIARALIEAVYAEADRRRAGRVYWLTQETNEAARRLYDKLASRADFVQYRRS